MKYTENALNILATKEFKGVGRAWIHKYLKGNENVEKIVSILNEKSKEKVTLQDFENQKRMIYQKIEPYFDVYDGLVAIGDKNFPQYRGKVKESDRPAFLFYKGNLELLDLHNNNATVIGLLNPDEAIIEREKRMVAELVKKDITIVSGLAFGCDSVAHIQALEGGKTIAILPSPIHNILPAKNKDLAFKIVEKGGLLISEYYQDFQNSRELINRYVERDRLQALYCDVIILAASYAQNSANRWAELQGQKLDSGARLAMGFAKDYGIPRFVMYDENTDFQNPMFDLNRDLLKEDRNVAIISKKEIERIATYIKDKHRQGYLF